MDLRESGLVEPSKHWYYTSKSSYLFSTKHLEHLDPKVVLEIGAGSAFFLKEAKKKFPYAKFIAMDPNYASDKIGYSDGIEYKLSAIGIQADLYLMIDVLEHIEDDSLALENYVKHAPSGSIFLISVPAFEFLWSPHDVFLGHFRRYTLKSIKKLVADSGLDCLEAKYLFGPIFPLVYFVRKIKSLRPDKATNSDMKTPKPLVNLILKKVLKRKGWPNINRMAGTSVFVVAGKS